MKLKKELRVTFPDVLIDAAVMEGKSFLAHKSLGFRNTRDLIVGVPGAGFANLLSVPSEKRARDDQKHWAKI